MPKPDTTPCRASGTCAPSGWPVSCRIASVEAEMSAGRAGLPDRQLAAGGVERKASVHLEGVGADESRALALRGKSRDPRTASRRSPDSRRRSARSRCPAGPTPAWRRDLSRSMTQPPRYCIGSSAKHCAARLRRGAARTAGPGPRAVARRITKKPPRRRTASRSRTAATDRRSRRASRYCSSVSGFLNSAMRIFQRVAALRHARACRNPRASRHRFACNRR